jgi:capsular exopolysaccharide synthesis family protein
MRVQVTDPNPIRAAAIANAAAEQFSVTAPLIEIPNQDMEGPVKITIIRPATAPNHPDTPRKTLSVAFGFMGGILFTIAIAIIRFIADRSVKNVSHLDGETLLGVIPQVVTEGIVDKPFVGDGETPNMEMFKQIRTVLLQELENSEIQVISVTSALAGEGKTTTCLSIAREFAISGYRVLVVEADLRKPSIRGFLPFSISKAPEFYTRFLDSRGNQKLSPTILRKMTESAFGLDLLLVDLLFLSDDFNGADYFEKEHFDKLVRSYREKYDFIFVDCPPVLPISDTLSIANSVDAFITVAQAGKVSENQFKGMKEKLLSTSKPILGVVLNMVPRHRDSSEYGYQYSYGGEYGSYYRTTPYTHYREDKLQREAKLRD